MSKQSTQQLKLNIIFRAEPEGGFTVLVPSLPGCVTYGSSLSESRCMAEEAISLYLEDMIAEGETIPEDAQTYLSSIEVALPTQSRIYA